MEEKVGTPGPVVDPDKVVQYELVKRKQLQLASVVGLPDKLLQEQAFIIIPPPEDYTGPVFVFSKGVKRGRIQVKIRG